MLTVTTPAASTALTTLAAVKLDLEISDGSEDAYLMAVIDRASQAICTFLNVRDADDGSATLGRETLVETLRPPVNSEKIILSRYPVVSITSVVIDTTTTLDADEYEIDGRTGFLIRLDGNDNQVCWEQCSKIAITYVAGWLLPNDAGRNLPADIEDAAISMIKAARVARNRDPLAKRIEIPDVRTIDYWVGAVPGNTGGMSSDVQAKLDPYRVPAA